MRAKMIFLLLSMYGAAITGQTLVDTTKSKSVKEKEYSGVYISLAGGYAYQFSDMRNQVGSEGRKFPVNPFSSGEKIQAQLDAVIRNGVGISVKAGRQSFKCDDQPVLFQFRKDLPRYNWSMVSSSFLLNSIAAGLNINYPPLPGQKMHASFKVLVGIGTAYSPRMAIEGQRGDSTVYAIMPALSGRLFTAVGGMQLRYEITQLINLSVEVELQHYDFSVINPSSIEISPSIATGVPAPVYPNSFNAINVMAGIGFNFR